MLFYHSIFAITRNKIIQCFTWVFTLFCSFCGWAIVCINFLSKTSHLICCKIIILSCLLLFFQKKKKKVLYIDNVNPHCCICILCNLTTIDLSIWYFCFPPLTRLDKPELAHKGYYLCSCLFRPADLPHLYCLSDTSHSAFQHWVFHHKTGPNRYLRDSELFLLMMCHEMFVCDMHEYWGTWFMVKGPFEMKVAHWCHFVKAAADVEICVGILCV